MFFQMSLFRQINLIKGQIKMNRFFDKFFRLLNKSRPETNQDANFNLDEFFDTTICWPQFLAEVREVFDRDVENLSNQLWEKSRLVNLGSPVEHKVHLIAVDN
jgi:hypothetical protein